MEETDRRKREKPSYSIEMPVGMFSSVHISAPCGMVTKDKIIGLIDDPRTFYLPERNQAEKLWFSEGSISYHFPLKSSRRKYSELAFSFEICSETACYNPDWPSDITVSVNDTELTTFTSIGDFGGRRGKFTASNWSISSTQFGILKTIRLTEEGVFVDHSLVREDITFSDLIGNDHTAVKLTLSIKSDAKHRGGLNLFGKRFGDYPQAIVMTIK
jgi:predicted transcriptional regulator